MCGHIQGITFPYWQKCSLFFEASVGLNWDWLPMATLSCMLTAHMFWNPVASPSLCWSPICPLLPTYLHLSSFSLPPLERTVSSTQRQKKACQAQDLQRLPGPLEQQHEHTLPLENCESTCVHMHRHMWSRIQPSCSLLTSPPFSFHFLRSCFFPSVSWCLRRWHLILLLLLAHWATWHPPITSLFFFARALRWPITEWLLSCRTDR